MYAVNIKHIQSISQFKHWDYALSRDTFIKHAALTGQVVRWIRNIVLYITQGGHNKTKYNTEIDLNYVAWFSLWLGCERVKRTGLYQCKLEVCVHCWAHCLVERIRYHYWDGWLTPYSTVRYMEQAAKELGHLVRKVSCLNASCHTRLYLSFFLFFFTPLLSISVFCSSLKLHHHQPFSLCLSSSLSRALA